MKSTASKKDRSSKRVAVQVHDCTGGCGARLHSESADLAMCLSCLGLYDALDNAGVDSVAELERRDRTCSRIHTIILRSGEPDAEVLARDFHALIAA